jgi:DNA-binding beta-propeller fold protein YncE
MRRLAVLVLLLLALMASPSAAAASTHELLGDFAASVPQDPPPPFGAPEVPQRFEDPCGVALDESQNVAVAVYHGSGYAVAYFDSSGAFLAKQKSPLPGNAPCDLVYAGAPQHLFGVMLHGAVYDLTQGTVLDAGRSTGVAAGPGGRIYVAHRHEIAVYEADGSAAFSVGDESSLGNAYGVAVDAAGRVYVGDASSDSIKVFDPAVDPLVPLLEIDGSATPAGAFTDLTDTDLAIEPNGNVLVVDNLRPGLEKPLAAVFEFTATGAYVGGIQSGIVTDAEPSGIAVAPDGTIYVTSGNQEGGVVYRFGAGLVPTAKLQVLRSGTGEGSVESTNGILCGPTCVAEYPDGEAVSLVATPAPHSEFRGWSVAGQPNSCLDVNSSCQFTMSADREVTAEFVAIPQHRLQLSVSGQGLVNSTPSRLSCRSQCSAEFDAGSQVTLTPEPAEGFRFEGFSGACSGQSSCTVAMTGDLSVGAVFVPASAPERVHPPSSTSLLLLVAGGDGTGSVSSDPAGLDCGLVCSATFPTGTGLTLKASPDPGSRFVGWSGCDTVAAGRCRVGLTGLRSVTASFAQGAAIELGRVVTRRGKTSLAVAVAEAGQLTLKAKGLHAAGRRAGHGGILLLPLRPDKKGLRALASHGLLRTQAVVRFEPAGEAAPVTLKRIVILRGGARR